MKSFIEGEKEGEGRGSEEGRRGSYLLAIYLLVYTISSVDVPRQPFVFSIV